MKHIAWPFRTGIHSALKCHCQERKYEPGLDITGITAQLQAEYLLAPEHLQLGRHGWWARVPQPVAVQAACPAILIRDAEPSAAYRRLVKHLSEARLTLADCRLDATLNAIFAPLTAG